MRRLITMVLSFLCVLSLVSCDRWKPEPKKVTIDHKGYRTGFYGDLYPINLKYKGDRIKISGREYQILKTISIMVVLGALI